MVSTNRHRQHVSCVDGSSRRTTGTGPLEPDLCVYMDLWTSLLHRYKTILTLKSTLTSTLTSMLSSLPSCCSVLWTACRTSTSYGAWAFGDSALRHVQPKSPEECKSGKEKKKKKKKRRGHSRSSPKVRDRSWLVDPSFSPGVVQTCPSEIHTNSATPH